MIDKFVMLYVYEVHKDIFALYLVLRSETLM